MVLETKLTHTSRGDAGARSSTLPKEFEREKDILGSKWLAG